MRAPTSGSPKWKRFVRSVASLPSASHQKNVANIATRLPRSAADAQRRGYRVTTSGLMSASEVSMSSLGLLDPFHKVLDAHGWGIE